MHTYYSYKYVSHWILIYTAVYAYSKLIYHHLFEGMLFHFVKCVMNSTPTPLEINAHMSGGHWMNEMNTLEMYCYNIVSLVILRTQRISFSRYHSKK